MRSFHNAQHPAAHAMPHLARLMVDRVRRAIHQNSRKLRCALPRACLRYRDLQNRTEYSQPINRCDVVSNSVLPHRWQPAWTVQPLLLRFFCVSSLCCVATHRNILILVGTLIFHSIRLIRSITPLLCSIAYVEEVVNNPSAVQFQSTRVLPPSYSPSHLNHILIPSNKMVQNSTYASVKINKIK